jgi:type II secretory pathway pseudopilin PulG
LGPRNKRRGVSLVEIVVVALILAVITVILLPYYLQQVDRARGAATKSGVRSIQIAVLAYSLDHQDTYPTPDLVGPAGLKQYADTWPSNPWTSKPMTDSGRYVRGDFHYEVWNCDPQGGSLASTGTPTVPATDHFGLIGYLADPGYPFVVRPLSHPTAAPGSVSPEH